jgi:hypothetical protein
LELPGSFDEVRGKTVPSAELSVVLIGPRR